MTTDTTEFLDSPFSISISPDSALSGSEVQVVITSLSGDSQIEGKIHITDFSGSTVAWIPGIRIPGSLSWRIPDDLDSPLSFSLFSGDCILDSTVIEVGDTGQIDEINLLEKAIRLEREALEFASQKAASAAIAAITEAAINYQRSGHIKLACCSTRQIINDIMVSEGEMNDSLRRELCDLARLSIAYARESGENAEVVSSIHLLASLDSAKEINDVSRMLGTADNILKSIDAPDILWLKHYSLVSSVLRKPLNGSTILRADQSALSKLIEIANEGMYFALVVREKPVRQACLDTLLPAYSQIFQRAEDLVIEDFFVGGSTYHLRLGQVGQARKLIDRIKDALSLTPSFSNALLAGIQSFATFALPRYDPSSRISLRVRRSESLEVYEICQMSELASDEQMLDAVRSWLESEDGHYYSNALSQISCTVADTIGFSSSSELGPGQLRQVDEQDDFPNVLCRVEKVIVSSQD